MARSADVIRNSARRFETSPVLIVISVPDVVMMADPLLGKVFYNLIDNAIRHGEKIKQIRFSCRISARGLAILCEDDGSGVAAEEKERIFDLGVGKNTGMGCISSERSSPLPGSRYVKRASRDQEPGSRSSFPKD